MCSKQSTSITLEGAINALAKHRDGGQVAAAGRSVFKILSINDETNEFFELINMRVGKNLNLNFSCNDVVWNQLDPNMLATGATNGAVVIWNLSKSNRNKLDSVFQDHKRTVNKICFHPNIPHYLLSGSQDGTMKLFDLRRPEASYTFLSQSESVRDVQFSPYRDYIFSAVQENGNVQLWDLRRTDHCEKQFTAHSGPVFSCDWHLEDARHLATAGRDKTIKVWDVSNNKIKLEHCIQTIASVARIKWRPQRKSQIASSSLVVDFNIYIWDYMRPFVPFAAFQEHKDVTTDFVWRDTSPKRLISAGKDGTVYQHNVKDADRPGQRINPCGMDLNVRGDIFVCMSDSLVKGIPLKKGSLPLRESRSMFAEFESPHSKSFAASIQSPSISQHSSSSSSSSINNLATNGVSNGQTPTLSSAAASSASLFMKRGISMFQSSASHASNSNSHTSASLANISASLQSPRPASPEVYSSYLLYVKNENIESLLSNDWLIAAALGYQLSGQSVSDLCEYNAEVADEFNRPEIAQTWRILRQLYTGQQLQAMHSHLSASGQLPITDHSIQDEKNDLKSRHMSGASRHPSGNSQAGTVSISLGGITSTSVGTNVSSGAANIAIRSGRKSVREHSGGSTNSTSRTQLPGVLKISKASDSEEEHMNDVILSTPTEKEFSREHQDFFFGDGDVTQNVANLTSYEIANNDNLTQLDADFNQISFEIPREAFQLRHPIEEFSFPPDLDIVNNELSAITLLDEEDTSLEGPNHRGKGQEKSTPIKLDFNANLLLSAEIFPTASFKYTDLVAEMLTFYAQHGDVQTSVSILLVLGERIKCAIDTAIQEVWYNSYIDLLSRFQLWEVINKVIKQSVLPSINSLNQVSTSIYTSCSKCSKQLNNKVAWLCDLCKTSTSTCAVCHEVVKGVYVWCQGCSHGGHIEHAMQWFQANRYCPSGCGHLCEYM